MKMMVERRSIVITPENETDVAYIEEVLKLKEDGDQTVVTRINASGLVRVNCLEIRAKYNLDDLEKFRKESKEFEFEVVGTETGRIAPEGSKE
jgi:hypothetical protein